MEAPLASLRVDKWLWFARFFKTRTLAARIVSEGKLRVNGSPVRKPSASISVGDTLTFAKERDIRVIRVLALGTRRGPAPEAQALYEDLAPPAPSAKGPAEAQSPRPEARPTKKQRRALGALKRPS